MIKESLYFTFDGINSMDEFGIMNVSVDSSGLYTETFMANRNIKEIKVRGNDRPYFSEIERDPITIPMTFYFQDSWDDNKIAQVKQWLNVDYYKPLIFSEQPSKIYYAMPSDSLNIIHNGLKQGYVTLNMRCDSPYSYSPEINSNWFDVSDNNTFSIDNNGDCKIYPQINIVKIGNGNLTIENLNNGNATMKFTNLLDQEELYINCEKEYIETSIPNFYRYDSFNDTYMQLVYGQNNIRVTGDCRIQFIYEYKFL